MLVGFIDMNWTEVLTNSIPIVVGFAALFVYKLSKRTEMRNAAAIVVMDIRNAEQVVRSILERGKVEKSQKNVLVENSWGKYKHLFASKFSYDDFVAFNQFFDTCIEIAEAKRRMDALFDVSLTAKASILQQKIFSIKELSSAKGQAERNQVIEEINKEEYVFSPNEPMNVITRGINLVGLLSNTEAFRKLRNTAKLP